MASDPPPAEPAVPQDDTPPPPTYTSPNHRNNNEDLEAGLSLPESDTARLSSDAPPKYQEQDMAEPLPPYMTRVRGVIRGQQPIAAAVPVMERRTGWYVGGGFVLLLLTVIGVGVGIRVASINNNSNNNAPPP